MNKSLVQMARLMTAAVLAITLLKIDGAMAQRTVPPSQQALQYSFAPIVRKATPAVVNVYVRSTKRVVRSPMFEDPFFREFFGRRRQRSQTSLGSGVIVDPSGLIVTNAHVVRSSGGRADIRVVLADRREFHARVVLEDKKTDIAILRIEGKKSGFPIVRFSDSDAAEVGDVVLAIGNPFGVGQTVTSGIISALARSSLARSKSQVFIQTDAAINPGNSGGALVDMRGRLVGINTAIFSKSGGSLGIGFAIPSNLVRLYVNSAMTGRKVQRPWLGARLETVTRQVAEKLQLARVAGALVVRVDRKGPAAAAGILRGDIIVSVDGRAVIDARAVLYRLATRGVGNNVALSVLRNGSHQDLKLALKAAPGPSASDMKLLVGDHPLYGARVSNIRPALSDELDLEVSEGVVIVDMAVASTAAEWGFRRGDVIVQIGREEIPSIDILQRVLQQRRRIWFIAVRRGGQILRLEVPG
jgi:Do/DeqQ family serine protease